MLCVEALCSPCAGVEMPFIFFLLLSLSHSIDSSLTQLLSMGKCSFSLAALTNEFDACVTQRDWCLGISRLRVFWNLQRQQG